MQFIEQSIQMNDYGSKLYYANYLLHRYENEESYIRAFMLFKEILMIKNNNAEVNYNLGYMY